MLTINDIRGYIAGLGIAADDNVYIGKMDNKNRNPSACTAAQPVGCRILLWEG